MGKSVSDLSHRKTLSPLWSRFAENTRANPHLDLSAAKEYDCFH